MEDRPGSSFQRHGIIADPLFLGIVMLAAGIRFYYSFHFLLSDEAFNLITIEALASGKGFEPYFFKHPPVYILISALFSSLIGPYPQIPSYISIIFSVLSLVPFYIIADRLMGRRGGLWAVLFLSVIPANLSYSTWIKQDAMLLFFFLWGIYFFMGNRFVLSGMALGTALLVKEFALFFFPLTFVMAAIEGKGKRWMDKWRGWLITVAVSSLISFWWYLKFGYLFYLIAGEALTGAYIVEWYWHYPWWFFLKNLPYDLTYPIFALFLIGMISMVRGMIGSAFLRLYYVPLLWMAVFYVPISMFYMKTPWFVYLATPALAMISAHGLIWLTGNVRHGVMNVGIKFAVLTLTAFSVYAYDHIDYEEKLSGMLLRRRAEEAAKLHGSTWGEMLESKRLWSEKMEGAGKVAFLEYSPQLQYLMGIGDRDIIRLKASRFMALDKEGLEILAKEEGISIFILNRDSLIYTKESSDNMASLWGDPEEIGHMLLFRTSTKN